MTWATDIAVAVLLGGLLAAGALSILAAVPRWGAASLTVRIAPYVRDVVPDDRLPGRVLPTAGVLPTGVRSLWGWLRGLLGSALGGGEGLRIRLAQAGSALDPASFRGRQLGWILTGGAIGAVVVIALAVAGRLSVPGALLPAILAAAGGVGYDMVLTARARARVARLGDELPTTLEFLALCLSAGENLMDSLRRISAVGSGELTGELRGVVLEVNTGSSLADALRDMSVRLQQPGLSRAVDQVIAALDQGAPLAAVLHAQAADAREDAKRGLIEQAGRKEIVMLLPRKIAERCYLANVLLALAVLLFLIVPARGPLSGEQG